MRHHLLLVLVTASITVLVPACKKKSTETGTGSGSGSAMEAPGSAAMAPGSAATGSGSATAETGSAAGSATGSGSATAAALTDPQIAAIVVAANQLDIDAGKLALKKSKNPEVKQFAELMVKDHTAVLKAATDLVTKLKITPEETDASRALTSSGSETRGRLEKLDGDAFDRAYVDNEVAYHKAVIGLLDTQLIPSATNPELKNMLVSVKPAFEAHLQHAEQVQAALAGGSAAGSGSAGSARHHKR